MTEETLLQRVRDSRAIAARARRLSRQLYTKSDQATLKAYADSKDAEADKLEREARVASRDKKTSH